MCKNHFFHGQMFQATDSAVYCPTCGEKVNEEGSKSKFLAYYNKMMSQDPNF